MAYYSYRIILIALFFTIAVPSSSGHFGGDPPAIQPGEFDSFKYLKQLCSQTNHTGHCWVLIKPHFNRFNTTRKTGILGVAPIARDLVYDKALQYQDKFIKLFDASKDRDLRFKYISCWNNYNDAIIHLLLLEWKFSAHNYDESLVEVDGFGEEFQRCVSRFTEDVFDPASVRTMINDVFGIYVEFLKVATINWAELSRRN